MPSLHAFCVLLVLSLSVSTIHAFEATGAATIDTSEFGSFDTNKKKIKAKAIEAACLNALDKYRDTFSSAQIKNYKKIREEVESDLSEFVRCGDPIDEEFNFATNEFSVVIKAKIKEAAFEVAMQESSDDEATEIGDILLVAFARQVQNVKQKDAKVVQIDQMKTNIDVDQTEASTDTDTSISSSSTETNISTTGGSTTQESEKVTYKVAHGHISIIAGAMAGPMEDAEYTMVEMDGFLDDDLIDEIMETLATKGKPSSKSIKAINRVLKQEETPNYILGVFDVGRDEQDPATGMDSATVTLKTMSLQTFLKKKGKSDVDDTSTWRKRPRSAGKVSKVMAKGKGSNPEEAVNNALFNTVGKAALGLLENVRSKGGL
jgi:hypothetical protein